MAKDASFDIVSEYDRQIAETERAIRAIRKNTIIFFIFIPHYLLYTKLTEGAS